MHVKHTIAAVTHCTRWDHGSAEFVDLLLDSGSA